MEGTARQLDRVMLSVELRVFVDRVVTHGQSQQDDFYVQLLQRTLTRGLVERLDAATDEATKRGIRGDMPQKVRALQMHARMTLGLKEFPEALSLLGRPLTTDEQIRELADALAPALEAIFKVIENTAIPVTGSIRPPPPAPSLQ